MSDAASVAEMGKEIALKRLSLLRQNDTDAAYRNYLLTNEQRDNLIMVFRGLSARHVIKELKNLPELEDFDLKKEL